MDNRIRILIALAPSADGAHTSGETHRAVARALRDRGAEIIHLGESRAPDGIAGAALQEDADAVVVWTDSAWNDADLSSLRAALDAADLHDVPLFVAGSAESPAFRDRVVWIDAARDALEVAADIAARLDPTR